MKIKKKNNLIIWNKNHNFELATFFWIRNNNINDELGKLENIKEGIIFDGLN